MLTDPIGITYNSSSKSLPRAAVSDRGVSKKLRGESYVTSDGEFAVRTAIYSLGKNGTRAEIILTRVPPDSDSDPFTGNVFRQELSNSVGLIFESNNFKTGTSTDLPLLQAALLSYCDSTIRGKLVGGEI